MIKLSKQAVLDRVPVETFEATDLYKALDRLPVIGEAGPWIAGGAIRRTLNNEKLSETDFDFFFHDQKQAEEFEDSLEELGAKVISKNEMNTTYLLQNNEIILSPEPIPPSLKIQVIKFRYFDSIEEVLDAFDYTLCQFGFDGSVFTVSDYALWDTARKRIVPHKITYGTSSLRRLIKYTSQGYTACAGALSNILQQVVDNPEIIEEKILYID